MQIILPKMDEKKKKKLDIPPNYVTLAQLQERWLKEQKRENKENEELELQKEKEKEEEEAVVAAVAMVEVEGGEKKGSKKKKKKKKTGEERKEVGGDVHELGGGGGGGVELEKGGFQGRRWYEGQRGVRMEFRPRRSDAAENEGRDKNSVGGIDGVVGKREWKVKDGRKFREMSMGNGNGDGGVRRRCYSGSKGMRRSDMGESEDKGKGLLGSVDGMSGNGVEMESGELGVSDRKVGIEDVAGGNEGTVGIERKLGKLGEMSEGNEMRRRWNWRKREVRREYRVQSSDLGEYVDKREGLVGDVDGMDGNGVEMHSGEVGKSDRMVGFEDVAGENKGMVEIKWKLGEMSVESENRGREGQCRFVSRGSGVYNGVGNNSQYGVGGGQVGYRRYDSGDRRYKIESDMEENEDKIECFLGDVDGIDGNGEVRESDRRVGIVDVAGGNEGTKEIERKLGEMSVGSENGGREGQGRVIRRGNGGFYAARTNGQYRGGGDGVGYRKYGSGDRGYGHYSFGGGNFKNRNRLGNEQRGADDNVKVWVKKEEVVPCGGVIFRNGGQNTK